MTPEKIPPDVLEFLARHISSVEQLRVLLLLHADPRRAWTVEEIARELRSVESSIATRLEGLYAAKVLAPPAPSGKHKFSPASPELRAVIAKVAEANREMPNRMIKAIYRTEPRQTEPKRKPSKGGGSR